MRARLLWWGPLIAGAALLVAFAPALDQTVVQSVARPAAQALAKPARADAPEAVLRVVKRLAEADEIDARLWHLQRAAPATPVAARTLPAVVASAAPPPEPAAPPLPYRMIGRYVDGDREGVILQGPDGALVIAHAGETLGEAYRVESLAGNVMVLNYLPLQQRQTMDIGIAR